MHGRADYANMFGHYLVICTNNGSTDDDGSTTGESEDDDDEDVPLKTNPLITEELHTEMHYKREMYADMEVNSRMNPRIRNYQSIIGKPDYIRPELGTVLTLPSGHFVVIIKTYYIRLIQRVWKRQFKKKYSISNLLDREMGLPSSRARVAPSSLLRGMLSFCN